MSHVTILSPITLTPFKKKRSKPKSKFLRVLTSTKTTAVLATVLGGLVALPATIGRATIAVGARTVAKKAAVSSGRGLAKGLGLLGKGAVKQVVKRPITSLVVGGILVSSGTARKAVIEAPKKLFGVGKTIGTGIEQLTPGQKEKGGKFGIAGLIATTLGVGLIATGAVIGAKKLKEKVITVKNVIPISKPAATAAVVIEPVTTAITTPLVSTEPLVEKKPTQPRRAKITQNVHVTVRTSQNRKFINQINY